MTTAEERGEWSAARPGRTLAPEETRYPLYRRLGGPQGRSGRTEKTRPTGIRFPDRPARSHTNDNSDTFSITLLDILM